MTFLVNSINTQGLNFNQLRNAFRALDTDNSGTLEISEIKNAFAGLSIPQEQIDQIFERIDLNGDGEINYTEFLTVTADRRRTLTKANLEFAFHHFDVNNSGSITSDNLAECFKREGKHLSTEEIEQILSEIKTETPGEVTFDEFVTFIEELNQESNSPMIFRGLSNESN